MLIVTYHAIVGPASPVCCPPAQLEADLAALRGAGFTFVSLDDCADWLAAKKTLPTRSIVVTFDDGYASVVSKALPILSRFRVPATVFVVGHRIGGDNQWPGQWKSIPFMSLADASQLKEAIAAGVTIGSHSWSHAVLTELDSEALQHELTASAEKIEQALETPVKHFAYPYGIRGPREIDAARRRYRTAVNAEAGLVGAAADPHDLCRIDCHDVRVAIRLRLLDEVVLSPYLVTRRALRGSRRSVERLFRLT
jgi:peptidoglycan/xylan/chitin deacetylase (PgdA/CDA1 family)